MTTSLRELRSELDRVPAPELDVADLVRRGEARVRRRRLQVAAGAATAVVLAVSGGAVLARHDDRTAPVVELPRRTDPNPAPTPEPTQRRLVYADLHYGRPVTQVHVGSALVDLPVSFSWVDATDDGAVVTAQSGRIFFTDGDSVEEIGTLGFRTESYRSGGLVRTGHTGSLAAWFDSSDRTAPVLVVYDTSERRVVARHAVPRCKLMCSTQVLVGDRVYWSDAYIGYGNTDLRGASAFDLSTGADSPGDSAALEADVRASGRGIVLGRTVDSGTALLSTTFIADHGRLRQEQGRSTFDLATGQPLELRVPDGIADGAGFDLVQWLDDDRFVLRGGALDGYVDNLFICGVARGSCRQAAPDVHAKTTRRMVNDRIVNM
jgi:hypothetical protein